MEVVECRYRGRVIGHLVVGPGGFLSYQKEWPVEFILVGQTLEWVTHD